MLSIIGFRTIMILFCFGMNRTGRPWLSNATTGKQRGKMAASAMKSETDSGARVWVRPWLSVQRLPDCRWRVDCYACALGTDHQSLTYRPRTRNGLARLIRQHRRCGPLTAGRSFVNADRDAAGRSGSAATRGGGCPRVFRQPNDRASLHIFLQSSKDLP